MSCEENVNTSNAISEGMKSSLLGRGKKWCITCGVIAIPSAKKNRLCISCEGKKCDTTEENDMKYKSAGRGRKWCKHCGQTTIPSAKKNAACNTCEQKIINDLLCNIEAYGKLPKKVQISISNLSGGIMLQCELLTNICIKDIYDKLLYLFNDINIKFAIFDKCRGKYVGKDEYISSYVKFLESSNSYVVDFWAINYSHLTNSWFPNVQSTVDLRLLLEQDIFPDEMPENLTLSQDSLSLIKNSSLIALDLYEKFDHIRILNHFTYDVRSDETIFLKMMNDRVEIACLRYATNKIILSENRVMKRARDIDDEGVDFIIKTRKNINL